tara:strand:- start:521 stop:793 length:273 start_codon:yes stop_codon:yes gene_type:complete
MKLSPRALRQLIKEEISILKEERFTRTALPFLEDIMSNIDKAHASLPSGPRGKEFFEKTLMYNIELMRKKWRAEQEEDVAAAQRLLEPAL